VWFVGVGGLWAAADPGSPSTMLRAFLAGDLDAGALRSFARLAIVLPMLTGFVAGRMTKEVQHGPFAWTLPGLRRRFAAGVLSLALLAALPAALAFARAGRPAAALALLCTGALWFALATAVFDPYPSAAVSRAALVALLAVLLGGDDVVLALVEARPLACAAFAAPAAAAFLLREFSAGAARMRPFVPVFPLGTGGERQWMQARLAHRPPRDREWMLDHIGQGLAPWLRATQYERFGKYALGWAGWTAAVALVAAGVAVLTRGDAAEMTRTVAAVFAAHHILASPFPRKWMAYPLTRAQRARVAFWAGTVHGAAVCALFAVSLLAAGVLLPRLAFLPLGDAALPAPVHVLALAGSILAWTPLLQYVQVRWLAGSAADAGSTVGMAIVAATVTAYVLGAAGMAGWVVRVADWPAAGGPLGALASVAGAALVMHAVHRGQLGRYYARADLV
ncbi:MAG TPA: hypothetical protein VK081_02245, partial [Planctomycetota bacterium]|nr:hypothetical protein [Planctomycetota bacterium]